MIQRLNGDLIMVEYIRYILNIAGLFKTDSPLKTIKFLASFIGTLYHGLV